jgi:hypothetical protein
LWLIRRWRLPATPCLNIMCYKRVDQNLCGRWHISNSLFLEILTEIEN